MSSYLFSTIGVGVTFVTDFDTTTQHRIIVVDMNELNSVGAKKAKSLVGSGSVDKTAPWSFSAADGNALLGSEDNPNWERFASFHLGVKPDQPRETKGRYSYPFGKGGKVYRSALIAIRQRAAQQNDNSIFEAAGRLLQSIDNKEYQNMKDNRSLLDAVKGMLREVLALFEAENYEDEYEGEEMEMSLQLIVPPHILGVMEEATKDLPEENVFKQVVANGGAVSASTVKETATWLQVNAIGDKPTAEHILRGENGDGQATEWWSKQAKAIAAAPRKAGVGFQVFKNAEGEGGRWFGWATNRWMDRDEDIVTDQAHREFAAYLDANPDKAPTLQVWHTSGTDTKQAADWWDYANGFFMYSGPLTEDEVVRYEGVSTKNLGMSHGMFVLETAPNPKGRGVLITKYRSFEVSELPKDVAANPYTWFVTDEETLKEYDMFTQEKREYLVERLGEDAVVALENSTEDKEKALEALDVAWKEANEEAEAARAEEIVEASKGIVTEITKNVIEALNIEGLKQVLGSLHEEVQKAVILAERVESLEEQVKHLLETEDTRIAKAIAPERIAWEELGVRNKDESVEADESEVAKQLVDELQKSTGTDWLANLNPYGNKS